MDDAHPRAVLRLLVLEVDRTHVDRALVRGQLLGNPLQVCGDPLGPQLLPGLRVQRRDGVVIARNKDLAVVVSRPIWAEGGGVVLFLPQQFAGVQIDGVDVAHEVLEVHGPAHDDRTG